jgi:hypothetical protein
MWRADFVRPLVSGILLVGMGGHHASLGHVPPNACALLTLAELSAAVGQPVLGGNPSQTGDGGGQCTYGYGNLSQIAVELFQFQSAAEAQKHLADELKDSQKDDKGSHKTVVETGVGDGAFSASADMAAMKAVTWSAVRGSKVFHLFTLGQVPLPPGRMRGLMLTAISR